MTLDPLRATDLPLTARISADGFVRTDPDLVVRLERLERKLDWIAHQLPLISAHGVVLRGWPGDLPAPTAPEGTKA